MEGIETSQIVLGVGVTVLVALVLHHLVSRDSSSKKKAKKPFLTTPRDKHQVPLIEKEELSHDVRRFRFGLPSSEMILGLPIGKHIKIFAPNVTGVKEGEWNGRPDSEAGNAQIQRSYTPTTSDKQDNGYFDLVLKVYKGGVIERFPDGGKMSQYLDSLKIGDEIVMTGPTGMIEYNGKGVFSVSRKPREQKTEVGMIAGGTGITPMLQIINDVLNNPEDQTKLSLLFANQTEDDILCRDELERLEKENPGRFKVWYTLDRPTDSWKYSTGFISQEMIAEHLPKSGGNSCVLVCGPPPMVKFACQPNLEKEGFGKEDVLVF